MRRILIVDDNTDNAKSLALLLRLYGFETRTASDGMAALEAAIDFQPEAVVLDLGLPLLDGYEVARRLKEGDAGPPPRVVAVSGLKARPGSEPFFDKHFVKPSDPEKLVAVLREEPALAS
jgi:DNA-binding response OmpR family regulator